MRMGSGVTEEQSDSLNGRYLLISFAVAMLAIMSRDISLFTHPQFYAEDGKIWYAQAYNQGWLRPLAITEGGYLNTLQRLIADAALLVPFRWAPFIMAIGGLAVQALPVPILLSDHCRHWASLRMRMAFAAVYVGVPDAREVHVVCTNAQWHFAIAMLLVAFAPQPKRLWVQIADLVLLFIAAVSGPFALLLLPFVMAFWLAHRQRWTLSTLAILSAGGLMQLVMLLHNHAQRNPKFLGASVPLLIRLTGGNAFLGALLGTHRFGEKLPLVCSLVALLGGAAMIGYCLRFAPFEVRLFLLYCFAVLAAGLRSPYFIYSPRPLWAQLLDTASQRYSFFPGLALLFAILWCAFYATRHVRIGALVLVLIASVGVVMDWKIPPIPYREFPRQAAAFAAAPPGSLVVIPVYPVNPSWKMELLKKPGRGSVAQ